MNYCTNQIDLAMPDKAGIYSKGQSNVILTAFFNNHPPQAFSIEKKNNLDTELFLVGQLKVNTGTYRVCLQTKRIDQKTYIYQIRIEN